MNHPIEILTDAAERWQRDTAAIDSAVGMVKAGRYDFLAVKAWDKAEAERFTEYIAQKYPGFTNYHISWLARG
jgi:hypothetical protein